MMQLASLGATSTEDQLGGLEPGASEGLVYVCSSFLTKGLSSGILFL